MNDVISLQEILAHGYLGQPFVFHEGFEFHSLRGTLEFKGGMGELAIIHSAPQNKVELHKALKDIRHQGDLVRSMDPNMLPHKWFEGLEQWIELLN